MADVSTFDSHASTSMRHLAASLMDMAPPGVLLYPVRLLKTKKITLATTASGRNKNAVVVWPKFIRFMVPDWSIEPRLHDQQVVTKRNVSQGLRLEVYLEKTSNEHNDVLRDLVKIACEESDRRRVRDAVSRRRSRNA